MSPAARRGGRAGRAASRDHAGPGGDALAAYRAKRDAARTTEPVPAPPRGRPATGSQPGRTPGGAPGRGSRRNRGSAPTFVVQEHHASSLHWDLRLEHAGVLASWAVPKGVPLDPGRDHLAVPTEDHPMAYGSFEGAIPEGEYGAGTVAIWDEGTYECEKWTDHEVIVVLHGRRIDGRYVLFTAGGQRWMLHRMDPPPAGWEPVPDEVRPMLCTPGLLPGDDDGWAYELKWDGVRAVAYVEGGRVRLLSRTGADVTATYPELAGLGDELASRPAVLDGEVVAIDAQGRPSFELLQQRMHVDDRNQARRLAGRVPATYLAFDVLHLDGRGTLALPYDERRALLDSLTVAGDSWAVPPAFNDRPGADVLRASRELGLEGVVAKRRDSPYAPGRRSPSWVKVKHVRTQEVVIGGWVPGKGRRSGRIGALLLGTPAAHGLAYAGKVGTGFTDEALAELADHLRPLERATNPFAGEVPDARSGKVSWVAPTTVGEVQFAGWTGDGRLRHPSWRGLRPDKAASQVVRET